MEDLTAKLTEVQEDLAALSLKRGKLLMEEEAIKKQMADAEVTYSIGDRFKGSYKYILAATSDNGHVHLVNLSVGTHLAGSALVESVSKITQSEFKHVLSDTIRDPVRYWDARKQCKC
jgi:hypothetical protein